MGRQSTWQSYRGTPWRHSTRRQSTRRHSTRRQSTMIESVGGVPRRKLLYQLANAMKSYRATPWGKLTKDGNTTYHALDYRDFPLDTFIVSDPEQGELTFKNAHAGDLLEHSKWAALQMAIWFKNGDIWTQHLRPTLAILVGFLHDIGKGGDCSFSCMRRLKGQEEKKPGLS